MTASTPTMSSANTLHAIVGRLSYDEAFAEDLAKDASGTLERAGLLMKKEAIEEFIRNEPERFDMISDRLAQLISPETLANLTEPTCA